MRMIPFLSGVFLLSCAGGEDTGALAPILDLSTDTGNVGWDTNGHQIAPQNVDERSEATWRGMPLDKIKHTAFAKTQDGSFRVNTGTFSGMISDNSALLTHSLNQGSIELQFTKWGREGTLNSAPQATAKMGSCIK